MTVECYACKKRVRVTPNGEGMAIAYRHAKADGTTCEGSREAYELADSRKGSGG